MIKLIPLNKESEEESASEEEVTKEALEEIALRQYAKALELQRNDNLKEATQLLRDLLNTKLLHGVNKPAKGDKIVNPLLTVKYSSYKNLGWMLSLSDDADAAIEAYLAASELDDTDVILWFRLGQLYMLTKRYIKALHAFQHGFQCNPRHWPSLDKIVTLLLGLGFKEECISIIYDALQLDPGYLRGLAYRKHIFNNYPHIKDYMEQLNPIYKWSVTSDEPFDEVKAEMLLKEGKDIQETFVEQQKSEQFKYILPKLKLTKPISNLTWTSVGESLIHMHHYLSENCYSHACPIEFIVEKEKSADPVQVCGEPKEVDAVESTLDDNNIEPEKNPHIDISDIENNDLSDKDEAGTDTEKVESDVDVIVDAANGTQLEPTITKKTPVRRRCNELSILRQWEWCKKSKSGQKKSDEDYIYETLRKMVPDHLALDMIQKQEDKITSPVTTNLSKLIDEQEKSEDTSQDYFGSQNEQKDVKDFINKYVESTSDIINILKDFLSILAAKWREKWPEDLPAIFIKANKCYMNHVDPPVYTNDNHEDLIHYTFVNLIIEEFSVNEKLVSPLENIDNNNQAHNLCVIEAIGMILNMKPDIFVSTDCLELCLRHLWVKLHIHLLNKCNDLALDCLYQLYCEFDSMSEYHDTYSLVVVNFTSKSVIKENDILDMIKFLERNKSLSTVMDLYERCDYEDLLSIVTDTFDHCKSIAKSREEEAPLDFAVQMVIILEAYWALKQVDDCFKWSLICLHEALKHYFRYTTGAQDYEKWSRTVVKILSVMEHIFNTEGLACLDVVSHRDLSQGIEDLIRIIGHQVETTATDMPFSTVLPWIILHYILQREEDSGRNRDKVASDEVPIPLQLLFIAHEQLGERHCCNISEGKLLYFILDTVVPRMWSPSLSKSMKVICMYMEQCVYCLYGHPSKKPKYLDDHTVSPFTLDWQHAQQLYEIFKPQELPALEGTVPGISTSTEQLFRRILSLLPQENNPENYLPEIKKYIKGIEEKTSKRLTLIPFRMRDIYCLLGDHYFKKEDIKSAVKYNMLDVVINNDRLESWARISLAKTLNLNRTLNSCSNLNNERDFFNPAESVIRCYKRALELNPKHCNILIEYGLFAYTVHSFCSRLLKQASESLSMEDFQALEKRKEDMLDATQQCFITVYNEQNNSKDSANEEQWLHFYMLGKVAEKRNKSPSVYLDYYMKAIKSLQETDATYPLKINYSARSRLCIEVLELHYRIHASILKYIEQHESKPIASNIGKVFMSFIEEWKNGPFIKKNKKEDVTEIEVSLQEPKPPDTVHPANILKRSISDVGEEESYEAKRIKMESIAAKVRRSASYDTERLSSNKGLIVPKIDNIEATTAVEEKKQDSVNTDVKSLSASQPPMDLPSIELCKEETRMDSNKAPEEKINAIEIEKKEESSSSTSSSSLSDSSSSESSSDSNSDSNRGSDSSSKSSNNSKSLTEEEIMAIVSSCLDALEDCTSRFPLHYKSLYRLAHYHFYYKRGKDIERCRDLMLANFISRRGLKLGGLFSERKPSNFFNNIWKISVEEVERAGGFAFHMSRSVLLTLEVLKEIDDYKTLLEVSIHLHKVPDLDKKYLRDCDRKELAQQACLLCAQSLKGLVTKFSQQADVRSNDVERQALRSLMTDIHNAYQKLQKYNFTQNSKQFTNLLIECYKLLTTESISEHANLLEISLKYCSKLKLEATIAGSDKMQNSQKKQIAKTASASEIIKATTSTTSSIHVTKPDQTPKVSTSQPSTPVSGTGLPKMSSQEIAAGFQNYLPLLNESVLSQQTAAALSLSYLSNISAFAGYSSLPNSMQSSIHNTLQNSFQAEFYRQFLDQSFSSLLPPAKKQKRGPKPGLGGSETNSQTKPSKSFNIGQTTTKFISKSQSTPVISNLQKSNSTSVTPSLGTVIQKLPSSMTVNLPGFGAHTTSHSSNSIPAQAHMSTATTVNAAIHTKPPMAHQQVSPGKTLQEKLAERQKHTQISKNQDINASISKLPSSLTITKTSVPKQVVKKPEAKKSLPFNTERPKPITTDEIIILDDD